MDRALMQVCCFWITELLLLLLFASACRDPLFQENEHDCGPKIYPCKLFIQVFCNHGHHFFSDDQQHLMFVYLDLQAFHKEAVFIRSYSLSSLALLQTQLHQQASLVTDIDEICFIVNGIEVTNNNNSASHNF